MIPRRAIALCLFGTAAYIGIAGRIIAGIGDALDPHEPSSPDPCDQEHAMNSPHGMHVCPKCDGEMVQLVDHQEIPEADGGGWEVVLRCPVCEEVRSGVFTQDECDDFDEELDLGLDILKRDLAQIAEANMQDYIGVFAAACEADAIWPEDFR
jgi:hypothetical protein